MGLHTKSESIQRLAEAARSFRATRRAMRQFIRRGQVERLQQLRRTEITRVNPNNRFNWNDPNVDLN